MRPVYHISGSICQKCAEINRHNKKRNTTEEFIEKAKKVHGDKYDYSKVEYINSQTKVCIICPEHGEFWQKPNGHLNGMGCDKCGGTKTLTTEDFIEKSIKVHGDKYDYSKVEYINYQTKVCIICPEHGEFWQTPHLHLRGTECPKCFKNGRNIPYTTEEFIKKAKEVHGNKYDYSKTVYNRCKNKIIITCPKHGEFEQKAYLHISGRGCPICKESNMEKKCRKFLVENKIRFKSQHTFYWLQYKSHLYLDFYLPDYNIAIECQGEQHFKPVGFGSKSNDIINENFIKTQKRDKLKRDLCEKHGIKIIYINFDEDINKILKEFLCNNQLENKY